MDVTKDWLVIEYDAKLATPEAMLRTIEQQKFTGKIVTAP